jgi:hypothetical protein
MFRKNKRMQQPLLLSDVNGLPERTRQRLEGSWAGTFRREVFERIDEARFAVLYSEKQSRPNVPVNVLLGLDILKSGRNWTNEEMYEHFLFDLQVRHALSCDNFGEGDFELRTLYYFRQRVAEHFLKTGENLVNQAFEQITDAQMAALGLQTDQQRQDSTMVLSNIADHSRLELLIQVIQRLWRVMRATDQERYQTLCQPYVKESAGQYTYRIKGREAVWEHIRLVGEVLQRLLLEMRAGYEPEPIYGVAQRFFEENFIVETQSLRAKENKEIGPGCLQSVDDVEATYRKKTNRAYKGYVANVAETCNPENPVQLIDQVQVAANQVSDIELLKAGITSLKARTEVETVVTDGAYVSPTVDEVLREQQVRQITTGLTGTLPDHSGGRLALSDFEMTFDPAGEVIQVTCPAGQPAQIQPAASGKSYRWTFAAPICQNCPFFGQGQCPVEAKRDNFAVSVPKERAQSAHRRRRFERHKQAARNLRTAVEATVYQLKHKWAKGKVRVRGLLRVTVTVLGSALSVNLRRIHAYYHARLRGKLTAKPAKPRRTASQGLMPA